MTQQEFERKRAECWIEFMHSAKSITTAYEEDIAKKAISFAFDRAFALGREGDTITQEDVEKAWQDYAQEIGLPDSLNYATSPMIEIAIKQAFKAGTKVIGKQEKDAEKTKVDGNVTISLHVALIPGQEEFYMGVAASHEAYTIDIPKSMIPSDLLAVINGECKNKVVTNIAIMK